MTESPSPESAVTAKKGTPEKAKKKRVKKPSGSKRSLFFASEVVTVDIVDEAVEKARLKRILRIVQMQVIVIGALTAFFLGGAPFFETVYYYYAVDTSRHAIRLLPLVMPNITNQAVLSWATNTITEIMTFGFGDYIPHLRSQQSRFTPDGWTSFVTGFDNMKLGEKFKDRQLVLTTVPSDTAVIVSQGFNLQHNYEWRVQLPVIMTYATNDNLTRHNRAVIDLTIARIPTSDNPDGIAIKTWRVD